MNLVFRIVLISFVSLSIISCGDDDSLEPRGTIEEFIASNDISSFELDEAGFYYRYDSLLTDGITYSEDDVIYYQMNIYSMNGDFLYDGLDLGVNFITSLNDFSDVIPALKIIMPEMKLNERATLLIPSDLAWGSYGAPGLVYPNEDLRIEIMPSAIKKSIEMYLEENGIENYYTSDTSEVIYTYDSVFSEPDTPVAGQEVTVHYDGYLLDSTKFDSSIDRDLPYTFTMGDGLSIPGWEDGIRHFSEGQSGRIYIPYEHAYGPYGRGTIGYYEDLIFEIEIISID